MSKKSDAVKRQKKNQRKSLKKNRIRKQFVTGLHKWSALGKTVQRRALGNGQRTKNITAAMDGLNAVIKKWNDKIPLETIATVNKLNVELVIAMKSKDAALIDVAIKNFLPVNQEILDIVKKYDAPVANISESQK
jgi:hypothetical protein